MAPVIAAVPILAGLILLVGLRWPAARAMSVCGGLTFTPMAVYLVLAGLPGMVAGSWGWKLP